MLSQNLRDCWESGIYTEVNWVIGVPGETDRDVEDGIDLILKNRKYIGRLANINPLILVNGGVYWLDPEAHNIKFREPKEELYAKYPRALPADSWYSIHPYIDAQVRKERFERIVIALHEAGFPVGPWAAKVIEDVNLARDPNRAGAVKASAAADAETENQAALGETGATASGAHAAETAAVCCDIDPAEENRENGRPAATPPLYRIAGRAPRVVRKLENHTIVFFDGWFYGVPQSFSDFDVTDPEQRSLPGVIKHTAEDVLVALIEDASSWANTRGQYDAQERQRATESYMRADSAVAVIRSESLPKNLKVLPYGRNEFIAVDAADLSGAFKFATRSLFMAKEDRLKIDPRSPLRRLAARLPAVLQHEIKRILRAESFRERTADGLVTQPDARLVRMLWRGTLEQYVKKPLTSLVKHRGTPSVVHSGRVPGEDFWIVSVVTKNALPELMWTMDGYNVVKYDGTFYGLPHGVAVDWEHDDVGSRAGVFAAATVRSVVGMIEAKTARSRDSSAGPSAGRGSGAGGEAAHVPILLGSLEGYNIIAYEGWVYGIAQTLGPIDLTETDPMGTPGVIRDVSRDVVENEILERIKCSEQSAA
jgi:hypothetical protein